MSHIALAEALNMVLLTYYAEEVARVPSRVYSVALEEIFCSGDSAPTLDRADADRLSANPLPEGVEGGRAAAIFVNNEPVGFATVATEGGAETAVADFFFQMIGEAVTNYVDKTEHEFDASYFKSLLGSTQKMSQKLAAIFDSVEASQVFIGECQKLFGAKAGAVLVVNDDKQLKLLASFGPDFKGYETARYVCFSGKPLLSNDPARDPRFARVDGAAGDASAAAGAMNVLAVPLFGGDKTIGVIYLWDKDVGGFTEEDQRMAQTLGAVLGSTIAGIRAHEKLVEGERIKSQLERYLSPNLVKEVIASGGIQRLGGSRVNATVLFSDIRGFTKMSEKYSPEHMVAQLNQYFEEMSEIIFANDGTLDKFVGDMIMVLFGVPRPMDDAPERAIRTAIAMQKRIKQLGEKWAAEGRGTFGVGIGINRGDMVFGNIGSSRAMGMTVIGDNVNSAQRLEAYAGAGEILISESMQNALKDTKLPMTNLGPIEVKGKNLVAYRVDYENSK